MSSSQPLVSVLVLNYNGREHLAACLPTLAAQTYPQDRVRIEVIDNGSTDGSVEFVRATFPQVRLHRFPRNLGFAAPYDAIARASDSDFIAFLNNDTRVEPTWLSELVAAADRHGAACVASKILDWDGRRIDFVGGLVSFIGHSWQQDLGEPATKAYQEVPLLFACGGSMLVDRRAYVDAGGFDTDFFAYFEDVDLGWRMSTLGYKTVLAPAAVTYHRLHGTAGRFAFAQRLRLYERNALAMLYKNYEAETLDRVLPAAIALSLVRGLTQSGIDARMFALGSAPPPTIDISTRTAVHLLALEDFCRQLPALKEKRHAIQSRRRLSDRDLLPLLGEPFRLHEDGHYAEIARTLIRTFEIAPLFGSPATFALGAPDQPAPFQPVGDERMSDAIESTGETSSLPLVTVIVLTVLGPTHLADCLSSLRAQTYPADRREVIVVDNASAEDPTPVVQQYYPGARVIRNASNVGFAVGNNVGAKAARGKYVVFLNDDTRTHPSWLRELVDTAVRRGAVSVGSRILSWDGALIDFVGGAINCQGRGFQVDIGQPEAGRHMDERPLLFGCGGALLVDRQVFLETGGWDEGAFAYYEDVELGWRFWLLGHEVWFSPKSIVYHKHHGTWGRWPEPPRLRLYERNSLRMLYTHLDRATLSRVLPAALLLSTDMALLSTALSRVARDDDERADEGRGKGPRLPAFARTLKLSMKSALIARGVSRKTSAFSNLRRIGPVGLASVARQGLRDAMTPPPIGSRRRALQIERGAAPFSLDGQTEQVPISAGAALCGVHDFLQELPGLSARRAFLQSARRRSDRDILSRFGVHWTSPAVSPHQLAHEDLQRILIDALGIAELAESAK